MGTPPGFRPGPVPSQRLERRRVARRAVEGPRRRSGKARRAQGVGLGLGSAIVKLHGFTLHIGSVPGVRIEIASPEAG